MWRGSSGTCLWWKEWPECSTVCQSKLVYNSHQPESKQTYHNKLSLVAARDKTQHQVLLVVTAHTHTHTERERDRGESLCSGPSTLVHSVTTGVLALLHVHIRMHALWMCVACHPNTCYRKLHPTYKLKVRHPHLRTGHTHGHCTGQTPRSL